MEPVINRQAERFIPVAKPSIGPAEQGAVAEVMRSGWLSSGPKVEQFEQQFAAAHGKKYGISCNSGTTALQLALMACDVGHQLVSCPTLTMIAVPNAILSAGGIPDFVDSEPWDGNIKLDDLDAMPHFPRAVVYVHTYGVPVEFQRPRSRPFTIEDCAESHYARFADGSPVGSRGDFACFSFYANKIIATGEGGMVLTNDPAAAERLRGLRAHAFTAGEHFHHREHALGARMTELQGAIGLVQHRRREEFISRRREIAERYTNEFADIHWLDFQQRTPGSADWVFSLLVRDGFAHRREHPGPLEYITRDSVRQHLADRGIETRSFFKPCHLQPHLQKFATGRYPVAESLYRRGLYLPLYPDLSDEDVNYIIDAVRSIRA
jgi:perosamine synthetase